MTKTAFYYYRSRAPTELSLHQYKYGELKRTFYYDEHCQYPAGQSHIILRSLEETNNPYSHDHIVNLYLECNDGCGSIKGYYNRNGATPVKLKDIEGKGYYENITKFIKEVLPDHTTRKITISYN